MTRIAVLQMTSGIDPDANEQQIIKAIKSAHNNGAVMLFTPEMSGLLDRNRKRAGPHIVAQQDSKFLRQICAAARHHGLWVALGSHPFAAQNGRWRNRSLVIDANGAIVTSYDKIHMFDVTLGQGDDWRESAVYDRGEGPVVCDCPAGKLGLSICYDVRFPALYDAMRAARPDIIAIPAAFTVPTGAAHWHVMVRARAIEAQAYIVAAAQVGTHQDGRTTYGHSLIVDPWGEVIVDMQQEVGLAYADIDLVHIANVRKNLPALANSQKIRQSGA